MSQHRDELRALHERYRAIADVDRDALPSLWAAVLLRMRDDGMIRGHGSVPGELAESRPPQRALREGHSACCSGSNRRRHHFPSSSSNPATAALGAAVGLSRARNDRPVKAYRRASRCDRSRSNLPFSTACQPDTQDRPVRRGPACSAHYLRAIVGDSASGRGDFERMANGR